MASYCIAIFVPLLFHLAVSVRMIRLKSIFRVVQHWWLFQVYQDCGRYFFHVYSPESCRSNYCVVDEAQVELKVAARVQSKYTRSIDTPIVMKVPKSA